MNIGLFIAQELCESRGGRPVLPVPNSPFGLCGRKATFVEAQELCESRGGCPVLPVPNSPFGLCGRKATFEEVQELIRPLLVALEMGHATGPN